MTNYVTFEQLAHTVSMLVSGMTDSQRGSAEEIVKAIIANTNAQDRSADELKRMNDLEERRLQSNISPWEKK